MPLTYKFDVLPALKEHGYTTWEIRKNKIFGESTVKNFRYGKPVAWSAIERLCGILECQPGDVLEYVTDEEYAAKTAENA